MYNQYNKTKYLVNMIAHFPEFENLKLSHKDIFRKIMSDFPPYSDHNFAGLWTYNVDDDIKISDLNGNIVLLSKDYLTREKFITFIGLKDLSNTIDALISYSEQSLNNPAIKLIPEEIIQSLEPSLQDKLEITQDPNNFDYILGVDKIIELQGGDFHSIRQKLHQFENNYPTTTYKLIKMQDQQVQQEMLETFYEWERQKGRERSETEVELTAIKRSMETALDFNYICLGAFLNGKMIGFTINEGLNDEYYIGHFGKYLPEYKGLFQVLEHETAKLMKKLGYKYMNYEQDLGELGMRKLKESWNPVKMLKKYEVKKKP